LALSNRQAQRDIAAPSAASPMRMKSELTPKGKSRVRRAGAAGPNELAG
jgi:hypothetical protein